MPDHVLCPVTITSPAPEPAFAAAFPALGVPNLPCGLECPVVTEASAMHFRCGMGHTFYAAPSDIVRASHNMEGPR